MDISNKKGRIEIVDISINSRVRNDGEFIDLLKLFERFSKEDKEILEEAVSVFYVLFKKNPRYYQFDFRFIQITA